MTTSITLGLLHGVLYGLTPTLALLVGTHYYRVYGPKRGRMAYAGVIIGQLLFFFLSFFGWKRLLWIWYYCEPVLVIVGFVGVLGVAHTEWQNPPRSATKEGPLDPYEAAYRAACSAGLVLCNPLQPNMVKPLFSVLPENKFLYLMGFAVGYAPVVFVLWDYIGKFLINYTYRTWDTGRAPKPDRYGYVEPIAGAFISEAKWVSKCYALTLSIIMASQINLNMNFRLLFYTSDTLLNAPVLSVLHSPQTRHMWDKIYTREERAAFLETASDSERIELERRDKIPFFPQDYGQSFMHDRPLWRSHGWDPNDIMDKLNEDRKRTPNQQVDDDISRLNTRIGLERAIDRFRFLGLYTFGVPEWDKSTSEEQLEDLYTMRQELDVQLGSDPNMNRTLQLLPQYRFVGESKDTTTPDPDDPTKFLKTEIVHPEALHGQEHTSWDPRLVGGLSRVQVLPETVRLPWHFPALPEPNRFEEVRIASDFLVTPDISSVDPDYKSSFDEGATSFKIKARHRTSTPE